MYIVYWYILAALIRTIYKMDITGAMHECICNRVEIALSALPRDSTILAGII